MANRSVNFSGAVPSPNTTDTYLPYSFIGGVVNYYGNGLKWNGTSFNEQETPPEEATFVDITSYLTGVSSPANGDKIVPTGVTVNTINSGAIKYETGGSANNWRCKRPA